MEKEFVNYNQALALKELGIEDWNFNIFGFYDSEEQFYDAHARGFHRDMDKESSILAPLKSQVFRWFREKHKLFPEIASYTEKYMDGKVKFNFEIRDNGEQYEFEEGPWISYEEAEDACIDKLIEIVKNGTKVNT